MTKSSKHVYLCFHIYSTLSSVMTAWPPLLALEGENVACKWNVNGPFHHLLVMHFLLSVSAFQSSSFPSPETPALLFKRVPLFLCYTPSCPAMGPFLYIPPLPIPCYPPASCVYRPPPPYPKLPPQIYFDLGDYSETGAPQLCRDLVPCKVTFSRS
ncbi:hypothetical protein B0F90DRAFT_1713045 [Multifurca ochricompacta]|uniref:Uncharacterized protein n=1 Tax=Multifurca ochricompacta TaxID=376703 RepID=A0AAD4M6B1_9AGAM|nr:hypothetical protein B0F90DRAFT_1713045 [Multifurca ochricompacta]